MYSYIHKGSWILVAAIFVACTGDKKDLAGVTEESMTLDELRGEVKIDGSSTVYPISEAVAEEFRGVAPRVRTAQMQLRSQRLLCDPFCRA